MPVVAIVDGVKIMFYANEHPPPHFHARSAEHQAVIDIEFLSVTSGFLPVTKRRKVLVWAALRREKLFRAFDQATSHERMESIE